jgi:hypothetical protein
MDATEVVDAPELAAEDDDQPVPWYTPGLYRRIQERRRYRAERPRRIPLRERLRARGLHWSTEIVVGVFVAVVVASLAAVTVARIGAGTANDLGVPTHAGGSDAGAAPSATPLCIAAPIAGSARRPCTY